jgi:Transposase/Transposase IS116/IS110/IS902 family
MLARQGMEVGLLFVGDDWAEDHHDVELQDPAGRRLGRARLPEGVVGITRLHELIAAQLEEDDGPEQVVVGIETDRGAWVQALLAAGYQVFPVNPRQVARYRERHGTSGAKSDAGDAHTLADMVRTDRHQLRAAAGDSDRAEAIKLLARAHQRLIWDRHRHLLRLRAALQEFFPAALAAFPDLTAADALALLAAAPDPTSAARLSHTKIAAALTRASRRGVQAKAAQIQQALRAEQLPQPETVVAAYAATVRAAVAVIGTLNTQIEALAAQVDAHFGGHPDAEIYRSQPGLGVILGARVLAEFGDDPGRYIDAKARKNYSGMSPITKASGTKRVVLARFARNRRLGDALLLQAFSALNNSPGARAFYDRQRARGATHYQALRTLANRLVGILHGCLRTHTLYDEHLAWHTKPDNLSSAA